MNKEEIEIKHRKYGEFMVETTIIPANKHNDMNLKTKKQIYVEKELLKQELTKSNNKIEKIKEIINIIDEMMYSGYTENGVSYWPTYENGEAGCRFKIIKQKLLSIIDGSDE